MDITSFIEIIIAIVVAYFFIRFIVGPVAKALIGVIIFIFLIYLLQRSFGFDLNQIFAPFGISLDPSKWNLNLNWILGPINHYIDQIKAFMSFAWQNVPKNK